MKFQIGDCYTESIIATEETIREIARVSGDVNPIHLEESYAEQTEFGKRIAHGLFCQNHISKLIANNLPGVGSILISQTFHYQKPVYINDEIVTAIRITEINEEKDIYTLETECTNADGETVLSGESIVKWKEKKMQLSDYAELLGGVLQSDASFDTLEFCTSSCQVPFLSFLENEKFLDKINPNACCMITTEELVACLPSTVQGILITSEPKYSFFCLHNYLADQSVYAGRRFDTVIGENCKISPLAFIADQNVVIGDNVEIAPFVAVKENVVIGDNCIIHENCVIGGKSFNFAKAKDGRMVGMRDLGKVILEDNVEICSNCHIANGQLPTDITLLEENVKLDACVHVGHGTKIGKRTLIPAGAQISGNVVIGEDSWIGVNATIANRIALGNHARVSLGSVVTKDVKDGQTVTGNFAVDHERFIAELKEANKKASKPPRGGCDANLIFLSKNTLIGKEAA